MIRINLLGNSKQKNRRSAAPSAPSIEVGDVGSPMVKVLVALMLLIAFNGYTWYHLDHQSQDIAAKMKVADQKNRELSEVKAKYREPKTKETWSGRGRMASWLKRKQDAGEHIDDYLV